MLAANQDLTVSESNGLSHDHQLLRFLLRLQRECVVEETQQHGVTATDLHCLPSKDLAFANSLKNPMSIEERRPAQ